MSSGSLPRIKLDLAKNEILADDTTIRYLLHDYSDAENVIIPIQTYSMDELFAEKLRALVERTRPRDLYDVVQIYERIYQSPGLPKSFWELAVTKFKFKNLIFSKSAFSIIDDRIQEVLESWKHMLAHQINPLESFEEYHERFKKIKKEIFG